MINYERGLNQMKSALREGDRESFLTFTTLEGRLQANLADESRYGSSETLRHERSRIVDSLNRLAYQCLGVDFIGLCLPAETPPSPSPRQPASRPWHGGDEISVLGQVYVLHDPVSETQAPDRSFVRRQAKAWQPATNRMVWIKQVELRRATRAAGEARTRLQREGQLLVKFEATPDLHFPRMLALDPGEQQATLVYAVTAEKSLAQVFGPLDKSLDGERALRLLRGTRSLGAMLTALHRERLSHRHLTPDDIVILDGRRDQAALQDLGLAMQPPVPGEGPPLYRAPEQTRADRLTVPGPRTDIYQLGALLYHFLTGHTPAAFLADVEPPSTWNRSLPAEMDDALVRALAEDPAARWPSIGELCDALKRAADQLQTDLRGER
jgi:serine/threonine protein kinase